MSDNVIVYSKPNCSFCTKVKELLSRKNITYNEVVIGEDITREDFMSTFPLVKTMPYVIVNGNKIGGYNETLEWTNQRGELLLG